MRYAGVSDSRGENNAERGNEDEAGDESQNPRCGTDFISWCIFLRSFIFLFFVRRIRRRNFFELDYRYNLVPFQEIRRFWIYREKVGFLAAFLNLAGNVIGFLPFGFIVPVMHKKMESFWKVSLLGFMFSLCVETIQLITKVGCFDVDDLMLNTLGAMIGCGAFLICNKFRRWKYGEEEV